MSENNFGVSLQTTEIQPLPPRAIRGNALVVSVPNKKVEEPAVNGSLNPFAVSLNVFGTIHTND